MAMDWKRTGSLCRFSFAFLGPEKLAMQGEKDPVISLANGIAGFPPIQGDSSSLQKFVSFPLFPIKDLK